MSGFTQSLYEGSGTASKSGSPATEESRTFKKTVTEVGRPPVTDHNINDNGIIDPPSNVPEGSQPGGTVPGMKAPKNSEILADEQPGGVLGDGGLGRPKIIDVQNDLIDESETASRV